MSENNSSPSPFLLQASALEHRVLQLAATCQALKAEREEALREVAALRESLREQTAQLKELRKKTSKLENNFQSPQKMSKLVKSLQADTKEVVELRAMIDNYIEEIEQCITFLSGN